MSRRTARPAASALLATVLIALGLIALGLIAVGPGASFAASAVAPLAPHRAVYEMSLGTARAGSSVTAVKGRMVYELTGSACEGYTQNMRFVTEMSSQDGQPVLTDLRSSTWEDGAAGLFRFNTTQMRNEKAGETTVGDARRAGPNGPVNVELTRPQKKDLALPAGTYFPVQHTIAIIAAAKAGQAMLRADLYDGSDKGDKAYDTLARIGRASAQGVNKTLAVAKNATPLDSVAAWPVSISYFERGKEAQDATPVYELGFLMFENGVSRRLVIDYGDFSIKGELSDIAFLDAGKCETK